MRVARLLLPRSRRTCIPSNFRQPHAPSEHPGPCCNRLWKRLRVDDLHHIFAAWFLKGGFHRRQQFGGGGTAQTTTHGRLRRQATRAKLLWPILPSAGPGNRTIMHHGPQKNGDDKRCRVAAPILTRLAETLRQSVQLLPMFAFHNRLLCVVTKAHYGRELFCRPRLAIAKCWQARGPAARTSTDIADLHDGCPSSDWV